MKKSYVWIFVVLLVTLLLSACGPIYTQPNRQEQLSGLGLFNRRPLRGVALTNSFEGEISGGYFLLAGGVHGEISSSTSFTVKWYLTENKFFFTEVPRGLIGVNEVPGLSDPEIEFVFKQSWLEARPDSWNEFELISMDDHQVVTYTPGAKLNPNNFVLPENLDIVNVYISPEDLKKNDLDQ